ncbi:MAG: hypothetical protein C5S38_09320 [Candidatus Methanophagaceae archaeon]|nr:MAG: hypothetical protein C5S38_09320 [Methanophagales archaeon]
MRGAVGNHEIREFKPPSWWGTRPLREKRDRCSRPEITVKQKLATGLQEHEVQWEIVAARKVKVYAPYAYILGIDAKVKGTAPT